MRNTPYPVFPRAVNGKKPQPCCGNAEKMTVGMGQQFIGFFCGCIKRHRMVHIMSGGKRRNFVSPVYRTWWSIDKVLHRVFSASLKNVHKSYQIWIHVGIGIFNGITHSRLCRKIDYIGRPIGFKDTVHCLFVFMSTLRNTKFYFHLTISGGLFSV